MNLHATINERPALYSHHTGEFFILPPNVRRFTEVSGHPVNAVDGFGRVIQPDWLPSLKTDRVKIFYTVRNQSRDYRPGLGRAVSTIFSKHVAENTDDDASDW